MNYIFVKGSANRTQSFKREIRECLQGDLKSVIQWLVNSTPGCG